MRTFNKREVGGIFATLVAFFLVYCCSGLLLKNDGMATMHVSLWHVIGIVLPGIALVALLTSKNKKYGIVAWITISLDYSRHSRKNGRTPHCYCILTEYCISPIK